MLGRTGRASRRKEYLLAAAPSKQIVASIAHWPSDDASSVAPLLQPGDVLLFDYRCLHRGLANEGNSRREVAYAVYSRQGVRDIQNFPSATTLEYD